METTRQSLLIRIRDRSDDRAWTQFRQGYEPLLRRYVAAKSHRLGLNWRQGRIDEAVHDVLVHLWFKLPQFELDHGIGRFRTYLWRVISNFVADMDPHRRQVMKGETDGMDPKGGRVRPRVLRDGRVELAEIADPHGEPGDEPDEPWVSEFNKSLLQIVLDMVREETVAANPLKWTCFERQWLGGTPAADVAAELGIKRDLVYQNSSRVFKDVCARFKEEFGEELVT